MPRFQVIITGECPDYCGETLHNLLQEFIDSIHSEGIEDFHATISGKKEKGVRIFPTEVKEELQDVEEGI